MKYQFPKNFWWGAATSGPQTEGAYEKKHESVMDYWFKVQPEAFFDRVGPQKASHFYYTYKEDIKLLKKIGLNSFRTSIQWTRLIKDFETGEVNGDALAFYNDVIDTLIAEGITPIINLSHFDMPIDLQKQHGGWLSRKTIALFVKYASKAFSLFGDRVKHWAVFNEPMVVPEAGYLYGFHYPNYVGKGKEAVQIMFHLVLATAKVIEAYRACENGDGEICTILNLTPAYPASESEEDKAAAQFADDFFNNMFVEAAINGEIPKSLISILFQDGVLWEVEDGDYETIKNNTVDFLGVNYYQPKRVKANTQGWDETMPWMPNKYFEEYDWPQKRINPYRGWEIFPKAIYDIAINMKEKYPHMKWFISENGMGVENEERYRNANGQIEDDYRIAFYEEHLAWLHKAIQEGSRCIGFHAWTAFDCWSWNNAYKNRYGYISVDLNTFARTIKKSGYWIKKVSENNGF